MPLIDLKSTLSDLTFQPNRVSGRGVISANDPSSKNLKTPTTLKTLPFQGDMRGYGDSGQPFIKFPIEGQTNNSAIKALYNIARTSVDFPIRGGAINYNFQSQTFTAFSEIDKERIKRFLESKPRGATFIQKQIGLQLSNPNTQTGGAFFNLQYPAPIPGVLQNTKIYNNGKNTLAQVGFSGTGIHAVRQGIMPIDTKTKYYSDVVGSERLLSGDNLRGKNRLLILTDTKMTAGRGFSGVSNINNINEINSLGISVNKGVIYNYLTGPGSTYGIGSTIVRRYEDTRQAGIDWKENKDNIRKVNYSGPILNYDEIIAKGRNTNHSSDYFTREQTYNLSYRTGEKSNADVINIGEILSLKSGDNPWDNANPDMIKFGFEFLSNDNPGDAQFIQFRALLNGGLTDNHSATWQAFKYMGRGEDFYTYQGFTRAINFAFMLAANSEEELQPIYNKLNYLASQVYPDYSKTTGMMRGPLVRLTIGDYIYRLAGFLESVNINIDQNSSWEIDETIGELPHMVMVNVSFKPIFNEIPRRVTANDPNGKIIGKGAEPPANNEDDENTQSQNSMGPVKLASSNELDLGKTKIEFDPNKMPKFDPTYSTIKPKQQSIAAKAEAAKTTNSSTQVRSRNAPKAKVAAKKTGSTAPKPQTAAPATLSNEAKPAPELGSTFDDTRGYSTDRYTPFSAMKAAVINTSAYGAMYKVGGIHNPIVNPYTGKTFKVPFKQGK
jgi:hypothetical protein